MIFKASIDISGDNNRGWIDHRISAILEGEDVGHITISYIPQKRFNEHYSEGVVDFLSKINGGPRKPDSGINKKWISSMYWHYNSEGYMEANSVLNSINQMSDGEAFKFYNDTIKPYCKKKYGKEFNDFKKYHVDYPIVSFIIVEPNYRHNGIGTALYVEGARLMKKEFGMNLYSSTTQSGSAELAWASMARRGIAVPAPTRKIDTSNDYKRGHAPRYMINC
jgi:hypothetical protein